MPRAVPVPRELFIARTPEQADRLYPVPCARPAVCLGSERRIWVVESGRQKTLGGKDHLTRAEETLLARTYRAALVKHVPLLTVFLLVQRQKPEAARA